MKYYVKFFENYDELLSEVEASWGEFDLCENIESIAIEEKEFEYATMKVRFFESDDCDDLKANFTKKYIKLAYAMGGDFGKLKVIFNGVLDDITFVSEKYYDILYVAKPVDISTSIGKKIKILTNTSQEKGIHTSKIYEGNLFLYCDKITHKIEASNLKFDKNPISLNTNNLGFLKQKGHNGFVKNNIDCVDVELHFQLARVKTWRENLFQKVLENFDGKTLSAGYVVDSVQKQLMFLKKPNVLMQKLMMKVLPMGFVRKEIDGEEVLLKPARIKGAIIAFWWQYLIKKVDVFAKISCFSSDMCEGDVAKEKIRIAIPFDEVLDVDEWKGGRLYNEKDYIFAQNSLMFCNKCHKSRHEFDDIERTFWDEVKRGDTYRSSDYDVVSNISRKIVQVMENIKKYILFYKRIETAIFRLNFEEAVLLNVNNFLRINDEKIGKIIGITHEIDNKGGISCVKIAFYDQILQCADTSIHDDEIKKIVSEMERVWKINVHSSKHLIKNVKVQNSYSEQGKIITKKYKTIEDFEKDFNRKRTKIKISFNNIPPIVHARYQINLEKL